MANFDIIECGYNIADETVNFGTRLLSEAGDNLYEASTVATLKCGESQVREHDFFNSIHSFVNLRVHGPHISTLSFLIIAFISMQITHSKYSKTKNAPV